MRGLAKSTIFGIALLLASNPEVLAREGGMKNNAFLVEEAYNLDTPWEQLVPSFRYNGDGSWLLAVSDTWPLFNKYHQVGFTMMAYQPPSPGVAWGLGDLELNYRYQILSQENYAWTLRLTPILPAGKKVEGMGAAGGELATLVSFDVDKEWITHWNAGVRVLRGAIRGGLSGKLVSPRYGASVVWVPRAHPEWNALLEFTSNIDLLSVSSDTTVRKSYYWINPGVRYAWEITPKFEIVPGLAIPLGYGAAANNWGVILRVSIENADEKTTKERKRPKNEI